jgi:hypothetical protein
MNTLHCLILDSMKLWYACSIACQALEDAVSASFFTGQGSICTSLSFKPNGEVAATTLSLTSNFFTKYDQTYN